MFPDGEIFPLWLREAKPGEAGFRAFGAIIHHRLRMTEMGNPSNLHCVRHWSAVTPLEDNSRTWRRGKCSGMNDLATSGWTSLAPRWGVFVALSPAPSSVVLC